VAVVAATRDSTSSASPWKLSNSTAARKGNKLYGHSKPRKRRGEFLVFLRYLRTLYPPEVRLGIVLDNYSPHLSAHDDPRVAE
jgi:hypothetical protein